MEKLKPCPFCGGKAVVELCGKGNFAHWCVWCNCGVLKQDHKTEAEAIEAWNTRTYPEGEVMLMGDRVFISGHGHYVKAQTCRIDRRVPDAPFCSECAYDWNDEWNYCPNCGAKVVED